MQSVSSPAGSHRSRHLDRDAMVAWYRRNRARSQALFDLVAPEAYYVRPIAVRHPVVFYEGHLPAFSFNTLVKRGLGRPSIDDRLERLFARGIDPHESHAEPASSSGVTGGWPDREEVRQFAAEADRQVIDALTSGDIERPGHPLLHQAEAAYCILEHEAMHQETLLYMWHRLPLDQKRRPAGHQPHVDGRQPSNDWVAVPAGPVSLGVDAAHERFSWDNERPAHVRDVAPFRVARHDVTNARFMEFVDAGGFREPRWWAPDDWRWLQQDARRHPLFWEHDEGGWWWRGMFDRLPLPEAWPVYVSHAEAAAYARWRGRRLLTEAEYQRAAFMAPDGQPRRYPWGDDAPSPDHGVFDFTNWDPEPAGTHPRGDSAWGIADLVGNGWEWTSTVFAPFEGFTAMASYPEYSADFFDGEHLVMKGASPVTAAELLRPSFRNWFRPRYPYVYATFRCAADGSAV